MEDAQKRVQGAVDQVMQDAEKPLRKLQAKTHRCAAECCENTKLSMHEVQGCISKCEKGTVEANEVFQREMQQFQDRLTRCSQSCQDKILDQAGSGSLSDADRDKFQSQMDQCILRCADDHVKLLPKIQERLLSAIEKASK